MAAPLDPLSAARRLQKLSQQRARLELDTARVATEAKALKRRMDTRAKITVGGSLIALARKDAETRGWLLGVLDRLPERDRAAVADLVAELAALP
ncbi:MAG: hypothetical protein AB7E55_29395 [Pigmentiphaga sp.]